MSGEHQPLIAFSFDKGKDWYKGKISQEHRQPYTNEIEYRSVEIIDATRLKALVGATINLAPEITIIDLTKKEDVVDQMTNTQK